MRQRFLAGTAALLVLAASAATAAAAPIYSLTTSGSYEPTLAPSTYDIIATGGGDSLKGTAGGVGPWSRTPSPSSCPRL